MADDRYGGYGRGEDWRRREDSIFSDDDSDRQNSDRQGRGRERARGGFPGRDDRERGGSDEDRGFFDRAGDEVRSWFGDEEAEQRRERDVRRDEARDAFAGSDDDRRYEGGRSRYGGTPDYERSGGYGAGASFAPEQAGYGQSMGGRRQYGERSSFGGRSHWDDNYRRWREQQVQRFDREYDDYCRERQQQFEQDFDSWRSSRLTEGGVGGGSSPRGDEGGRERTTRRTGSQGAGATTTGGGTASATRSSTGSSPGETENAVGAGGETGASRGRGGRSRS